VRFEFLDEAGMRAESVMEAIGRWREGLRLHPDGFEVVHRADALSAAREVLEALGRAAAGN
jgi:hypothetical protein